MNKESPLKPLRVTQRNDEKPEFFAMRAWVKAMYRMDDNAMRAAAKWIAEITNAAIKGK